jgi:phosphate uptake regulator
MEIRKVQKLGYSTIVVSLPRSWVKDKNLKKGDSVIVRVDEDGNLRIEPYEAEGEKRKREQFIIDVSQINSPGLIKRILIGNYVLGHDNLVFINKGERLSPQVLKEIHEAINRLAAMEIVEQNLHKVVVQCFIDPTKFRLTGLIRRMYTLIFSMIEAIQVYLSDLDLNVLRQIVNMENEADRLYWLIVRQILLAQKSWKVAKDIGIEHPYHIVGNRALAKSLEEICDRIEDVANELGRIPIEAVSEHKDVISIIDTILGDLREILSISMMAFIELDMVKANEILNNLKVFRNRVKELDTNFLIYIKEPLALSVFRVIVSSIMRVADSADAIAEITINRALEIPSKICKWEIVEEYLD